jgi:hypothetical protein
LIFVEADESDSEEEQHLTAKQRAEQRQQQEREEAELALLVMDKDAETKKGYNLKDLLKAEKLRQKQLAKGGKKNKVALNSYPKLESVSESLADLVLWLLASEPRAKRNRLLAILQWILRIHDLLPCTRHTITRSIKPIQHSRRPVR